MNEILYLIIGLVLGGWIGYRESILNKIKKK